MVNKHIRTMSASVGHNSQQLYIRESIVKARKTLTGKVTKLHGLCMSLWSFLAEILSVFLLGAWFATFRYISDRHRSRFSSHRSLLLKGGISDQRRYLAALTPVMTLRDRNMFYRYLAGANVYFEFGSGGSTAQAALRVSRVISVESDA
jgi:hypothetical protein